MFISVFVLTTRNAVMSTGIFIYSSSGALRVFCAWSICVTFMTEVNSVCCNSLHPASLGFQGMRGMRYPMPWLCKIAFLSLCWLNVTS